jgi:hypothetical protein
MVRQARVLALVGLWPSVIFRIYAWLTFIVGVVLAIFTVILAMQPPRDPNALPIAVGLTVMCFLLGCAYRWVSRGMLRSNPWAFAMGLLLLEARRS